MSENVIKLPESTNASTSTDTQYGMCYPDGTVQWNKVEMRGREYAIKDVIHKASTGYDWSKELERRAKAANLNPYDYSNQHRIVTRTVILAVTEVANHTTLRPWPAPDPGQRPQPIAETVAEQPVPAPAPPWN